jgi:hypothetical protein
VALAPSTGAPTAADVVASIHGTSLDTQLTARALADMTDAQFQVRNFRRSTTN